MVKRLTCFNHYGIGDLFESREFVLEWMRVLGVSECEYACRYPAVFADLPQIKTRELTGDLNMRHWASKQAGHYLVNTWIGALNGETNPKGDFVLWPGVGCTVEHIHRMHSDYMQKLGLGRIQRPPQDFLTTVNYSKVNLGRVDEFVRAKEGKKLVLVCNGPTGSGHATNFDMATMAGMMPVRDDVVYLLTQPVWPIGTDTYLTDDITERNGRCDVLAISYLSTFCDVIVGRCSGAQMVCETRDNWMDPSKTLISFTSHRNGASFVHQPEAMGLKMKLVHSTATTPEEAATVLQSVL